MGKFEELREKYPVFIYKAYYVNETKDTVEIGYEFSVPDLAEFRPSWSFRKPEGFTVKGDLSFERLAFSLGMATPISPEPISTRTGNGNGVNGETAKTVMRDITDIR